MPTGRTAKDSGTREGRMPSTWRGTEEMSRRKARQDHQHLAVVLEDFRSSLQIKMDLQMPSLALSYLMGERKQPALRGTTYLQVLAPG